MNGGCFVFLVAYISSDPDFKDDILSGLVGSYLVRVCAQNLAGRGACSVDELVTFIGG